MKNWSLQRRRRIPSPEGKVAERSEVGRGMAIFWTREKVCYSPIILDFRPHSSSVTAQGRRQLLPGRSYDCAALRRSAAWGQAALPRCSVKLQFISKTVLQEKENWSFYQLDPLWKLCYHGKLRNSIFYGRFPWKQCERFWPILWSRR